MKILFTWMTLLASVVCGLGYGGNTGSYGTVGSLPVTYDQNGNPILTGNGGALTNVATATLPVNAKNFIQAAGIVDSSAQQMIVNFQNELTAYGVTNADFGFLKPYLNPSAQLTYMGRSEVYSNITYQSTFGAFFNGSRIVVPNMPDMKAATLFVVYRFPRPVAISNNGFLIGVNNTNTGSSFYEAMSEGHFGLIFQRSGSTTWPVVDGNYTNLENQLIFTGTYTYTMFPQQQMERHVLSISSDGAGNMSGWNNTPSAQQMQFGLTPTKFGITSTVTNTDALTTLMVGSDFGAAGSYNNPINAEIAAWGVVWQPMSTNIEVGVTRALRRIEQDTTDTIFAFDSRGGEHSPYTNAIPWYFSQETGNSCQYCWTAPWVGGTTAFQWDSASASNLMYGLGPMTGIKHVVRTDLGINDTFANGSTASQVVGWLLGIASFGAADPNAVTMDYTPWTIDTNSSALPWTLAHEQQRQLLCSLIQSNSAAFAGGIKNAGKFITVQDMSTNGPFTNDGVHTTNGVLDQAIEFLPITGQIVSDFDGNISAGGSFIANTFTATNAAATSTIAGNLSVGGSTTASWLQFTNAINGGTNANLPANTTTIRAWVNFTNVTGGVFKLPLYQ